MNKQDTADVDLYGILGIPKGAPAVEVRRGYKRRALETHPDKLDPISTANQKEEAEKQFHAVREAFEILNDPGKRKEYDRRNGIRPDLECTWERKFTDEASLRRARERQAWAEQAEARYQARMAELRENARREREIFFEQQKSQREDSVMIAQMLDALCRMDSAESEKSTAKANETQHDVKKRSTKHKGDIKPRHSNKAEKISPGRNSSQAKAIGSENKHKMNPTERLPAVIPGASSKRDLENDSDENNEIAELPELST